MKYLLTLACLLLITAACIQESESTDQLTRNLVSEKALIDKGVRSLRIAEFYIPDEQDASTKEPTVSEESVLDFYKKNKLYRTENTFKEPVNLIGEHYRAFVKSNVGDPRLGRFRRETAETFLKQGQPLSTPDKAYFTHELIAGRSSNLALLCTSVQDLRGKISVTEHSRLLQETHKLMNQYEAYFKADLASNETKPTATFRQRAVKAQDARYDELALEMIQTNRQLLQANVE